MKLIVTKKVSSNNKGNREVLRIVVQEIKIDDLKIIKKIDWLSSSFTIFFLDFLRLLSLNSLNRVELNQTSVNQIQPNLIFNISPRLQIYSQ